MSLKLPCVATARRATGIGANNLGEDIEKDEFHLVGAMDPSECLRSKTAQVRPSFITSPRGLVILLDSGCLGCVDGLETEGER